MPRTWTRTDGSVTYVGLTEEAIRNLGDIITIVPRYNFVQKDKAAICIESTRKLTNVKSPVDGSIILVNNELLERPNVITANDWIFAVEVPKASNAV